MSCADVKYLQRPQRPPAACPARLRRRLTLLALLACCMALLCACDSSQSTTSTAVIAGDVSSMLDIDDPNEKAGVVIAKQKVQELGRAPRIIATSPAVVDICDRLELDLVGVSQSDLFDTPERYADVAVVGAPMSPDMEIVGSLAPDWVLSPVSLKSDLEPKYEAVGTDYAFLNLKSVQGFYRSIQEMGEIFDREEQAQELVDEFTDFYRDYQERNASKGHPKVLILMGLPGSYVIATENSYVGNLVELAGGENVYAGSSEEFLTVNTEDMKTKEPDIILRASHALPDQVKQMFDDEFQTNDIWKHFDAVKEGRVYDLPYETFGMSAGFDYTEALETLQDMLHGEGTSRDASESDISDEEQALA